MKKNDGYQKLKKKVLGCYDVFSDFFTKAQIPQEGDSFDELKNQAKKISNVEKKTYTPRIDPELFGLQGKNKKFQGENIP